MFFGTFHHSLASSGGFQRVVAFFLLFFFLAVIDGDCFHSLPEIEIDARLLRTNRS